MEKFKIVTLRDNTKIPSLGYHYSPDDPVVKDFYSDQSLWNQAPANERAWLYTFYQEKTPRNIFNEDGFSYAKFASLMNETPEWLKKSKAYKIILSDARYISNMSILYTLYRYVRDWLICYPIKWKYHIDNIPNQWEELTDDQIFEMGENVFMDYWLQAAQGWGKDNGGFFTDLLNYASYGLDILIPGTGAIIRGGMELGEKVGLTGAQAANGDFFYIPDFSRNINASNQNNSDDPSKVPPTQAGFSGIVPIIFIAGIAFAFLRKRGR